jgi:hypothetical protein
MRVVEIVLASYLEKCAQLYDLFLFICKRAVIVLGFWQINVSFSHYLCISSSKKLLCSFDIQVTQIQL